MATATSRKKHNPFSVCGHLVSSSSVADDTDGEIRVTGGEMATVVTAPQLPHEIIVEILSRLPVKSLCRFKCVSKLWLSTISTPQFAKTHLDLAFQNNTQKQVLMHWEDGQVCSIDWESINADDVIKRGLVAVELHNSLEDNPCSLNFRDIVSFSNGLVCISDYDNETFLVINPCTGESRKIPLGSQKYHNCYTLTYGFGYSSKSDDYKLVIIDSEFASMYSLWSDSWSEFTPPLNYRLPFHVSGVLLNGALHWIGWPLTDDECVVVSLDFVEKTIREMPVPPMSDYEDVFPTSLGVLNGCLCAHYYVEDDPLWVMREYNNGKSWTKVTTSLVPLDISALGANKRNAYVNGVEEKIVLCTFENGTHGIPTEGEFNVGTYVESLISPNHYVGELVNPHIL